MKKLKLRGSEPREGYYHIGGNLYYKDDQSNEIIFSEEGGVILPHSNQEIAHRDANAWFYLASKAK